MKKKIQKTAKRLLAVLLAVMMVVGTMTVSTFAVEYEAPSSGMEAEDIYITGSAYAASTVILSILGVNVTSSNGAGIDGSDATAAYGTDSSNLGIFGSDINDNPDPYFYNYFYNLNSTQTGGEDYSMEDMAAWTATPYTLRWDSNKNGSQGQASGTVTISINGVTKTCNPAFYYEPDIIIGTASSYADELASYQATYNEDYDPVIISAVSSSGTRSDSLGLEYNMFEMSANLVDIGEAIAEITEETGKITRYDQTAYEIAVDYDKYNRGLYYWAQSAFESGALTKINYVSSITYDSDSELWFIGQDSSRTAQYASGIGVEVYDLMNTEEGYTFSDGTTITADDISTTSSSSSSSSNRGGSGSATTGFYLTSEQLIDILTVYDEDGNKYTGIIIGSAGSDSAYTELTDAGIAFLSNLPSCAYGMTMQANENGMGIAFYLSFFYGDQCEELDPVSLMGYWLEHFYHVSDTDAMQTVLENMLSEADLNSAYSNEDLDIDRYDEEAVEDLIVAGIEYYQETIEPALDAAAAGTTTEEQDEVLAALSLDDVTITSSSMAYWSTLDTEIGIGSDNRNLNAEHDYVLVEEVAATCASEGYRVYECANHSGETYTSTLEMIDHTYELTASAASTLTSRGYETYTCSVCGDTYTDVLDYIEGLYLVNGVWCYYVDGSLYTDYTGLYTQTNGVTYYIEEGICTLAASGMIDIDETTYYIVNSRLQTTTGLLKYGGIWYYLEDGEFMDDYTGFYQNTSTGVSYYVEEGICTLAATGIVEITTTSTVTSTSGRNTVTTTVTTTDYYYVVNSRLQSSVTGMRQIDGTWYYIVEGKVMMDYTGAYTNESTGVTYYIENGVCDLATTAVADGYYFKNSRVAASVSGLILADGTWYYVESGVVQTDYTGLYTQANNVTYYIEEGICTLSTTTTYEENGVTYVIVNSRVTNAAEGIAVK